MPGIYRRGRNKNIFIWEDAQGRGGSLTALGERQQKSIAKRLFQHYPEIFQDSAYISARSSTSIRCVLSMAAFTEQLKEFVPSLQITREACQRYMDYIAYTSPETAYLESDTAFWRKDFHAFEKRLIRPQRLMASLFTQPERVENPLDLMMGLYWIAADMQNVELPVSFYDLFEKEELFSIWQTVNYRMYVCNANAPINQGVAAKSALHLLNNILDSADQAIRKGTPCATLRFGHDTHLIRLLTLMQIEGCAQQETNPIHYHRAWQDFQIAPMGANLQIIFFKNAHGNILVKLLHNEKEVQLPIPTSIPPYYSWKQVKEFYREIRTGK